MKSIARIAFRFVLNLHPYDFRVEFGDEMLWIFDEQMAGQDRTTRAVLSARLLFDVLRSAFLQRISRERSQPDPVGLHFAQI